MHHFFPETKHSVAKQTIRKRVSDTQVIKYVDEIIDSFGDVGLGLGSQISQLIELSVLDDLDHFIKEQLHIKYYIRNMDDFVLIHNDKEYLKYCLKEISKILSNIGLSLNNKTMIQRLSYGITFLKWKFILKENGKVYMCLPKKWLSKKKRKISRVLEKEKQGYVLIGTSQKCLNGIIAYASQGNTYVKRNKLLKWYREKK
ncbi:MAG: RNA-directed DNA polymerase [Bacteroidales bacterium]|nr:RNA-directed DNA polymerase [Candidatus Scybalousia scybalohippi]